jgi:phosphoesterase RecJ-like protein
VKILYCQLEGIVNYGLAIKGINITILIVERGDVVKLSLRSKGNIEVNKIASKYFNGGGHINASGGISYESVNDTIIKLENIFKTNF